MIIYHPIMLPILVSAACALGCVQHFLEDSFRSYRGTNRVLVFVPVVFWSAPAGWAWAIYHWCMR